jgi:hypothetical protein
MKSLSSAIVAASGILSFTAGAFIRHGDSQFFVMSVCFFVAAIGLWGWWSSLFRSSDQSLRVEGMEPGRNSGSN